MKTQIYLLIACFTVLGASCKKKETRKDIVTKFVEEVKADQYTAQQLPDFDLTHIDALFEHAADKQVVRNFPWPEILAYYPGEKEVGFVMLYAIEVIRQPQGSPVRGVHIHDANDPERKVTLDDILPVYQAWWSENRGKSADELQRINPLEDTGLVWFGSVAVE